MQDPASEIKDVVRILLKGKHSWCCNKEGGCTGRLDLQIQNCLWMQGASQSVWRSLIHASQRMPSSFIPFSRSGAGIGHVVAPYWSRWPFQTLMADALPLLSKCRKSCVCSCLQRARITLKCEDNEYRIKESITISFFSWDWLLETRNLYAGSFTCRREIFDLYQYWYDANKNIEFVATKIGTALPLKD